MSYSKNLRFRREPPDPSPSNATVAAQEPAVGIDEERQTIVPWAHLLLDGTETKGFQLVPEGSFVGIVPLSWVSALRVARRTVDVETPTCTASSAIDLDDSYAVASRAGSSIKATLLRAAP